MRSALLTAAAVLASAVAFGPAHADDSTENELYPWRAILDSPGWINKSSQIEQLAKDWTGDTPLWRAILEDTYLKDDPRQKAVAWLIDPSERYYLYYRGVDRLNYVTFGHNSNTGVVHGTAKDDKIFAEPGRALNTFGWGPWAFKIFAGAGHDEISGTKGNDWISGGNGKDYIEGRDGNDFIRGGRGTDHINGNYNNDIILGGHGTDYIHDGPGSDFLYGGPDFDILYITSFGKDRDVIMLDGNNDPDLIKVGNHPQFMRNVHSRGNFQTLKENDNFEVSRISVNDVALPSISWGKQSFTLHPSALKPNAWHFEDNAEPHHNNSFDVIFLNKDG